MTQNFNILLRFFFLFSGEEMIFRKNFKVQERNEGGVRNNFVECLKVKETTPHVATSPQCVSSKLVARAIAETNAFKIMFR